MEQIILLVAILFIIFLSFALLISGVIMHMLLVINLTDLFSVFKLNSKRKMSNMKVSEDDLSSSLSLNFFSKRFSKK